MTTGSDTVSTAGDASLPAAIQAWFEPDRLQSIFETGDSQAARLAADWLARGGKRWRPLLSATVCRGLIPVDAPLPDAMGAVVLAAECLHKASLIHDDIEDTDDQRYGRPALHRAHGIPVALNVGDLLVGEGYTPADGRGSVAVRVAHGSVETAVSDAGCGIESAGLTQVFDHFFTTVPRNSLRESGMGLGLSIAQAIVQNHGGTIRAESQPGEGSVFAFSLPA